MMKIPTFSIEKNFNHPIQPTQEHVAAKKCKNVTFNVTFLVATIAGIALGALAITSNNHSMKPLLIGSVAITTFGVAGMITLNCQTTFQNFLNCCCTEDNEQENA